MSESLKTFSHRFASTLGILVMTFTLVAVTACGSDTSPAEEAGAAEPAATLVQTNPTPEPTEQANTVPDPAPTKTPAPTATPEPTIPSGFEIFADVPGIVDPQNFGWPRVVETQAGRIEIPSPPERVYSLSLGHAEMVVALSGSEVLVAAASFFQSADISAAHEQFADLPDAGTDPEQIIALNPEIVIASAFTSADLVDQLTDIGILVVKADLENSALGNVPNILLQGYILGAEKRAVELANEVESRVGFISDRISAANLDRPRVLSMSRYSDIYVAGTGSTEGGIIESAGGINAAAESGIDGHQVMGIEGIAAVNPDVILLAQPEASALALAEELYTDPALQDVPAVKNRRIIPSHPPFNTTLSHWNVRGIEDLASYLYPELFEDVTFPPFTHP